MPKHFDLDVNQMFLVILCMADMKGDVANMIHGVADTMLGAADVIHVRCSG